jgi:peptide/nickel transport system substrate-binding protein
MRRRGLLSLTGFALMLSFLLTACGAGGSTPTGSGTSGSTPTGSGGAAQLAPGTPKQGGSLTIGLNGEIDKIDPHKSVTIVAFQVNQTMYESLVTANDQLDNVVPQLAEKWDQPDATTYIFHLRKGVKFHNGKELKAEDVLFSYERIMADATGSPRKTDFKLVEKMEQVDEYTVKLTLQTPFAPILSKLENLRIMPKGENDFDQKPIGTGPFQFVEWVSGQKIVAKAFPDYWGGAPYLDQIVFRPIPEAATKLVELKTGGVDMLNEVPFKDIAALEKEANLQVYRTNSVVRDHLGFNVGRKPFDDKLVRQAIAWAIDREGIASALMYGYAKPAHMAIPDSNWAFLPAAATAYGYDLKKAKELLTQAGYPNGFETTIKVSPTYPEQVKMAELIQQSLSEIGVKVNILQLEWSTWIKEVISEKNFDMEIVLISGGMDPDDFLYQWYRSGEPFNFLNYNSPTYDETIQKARVAVDADERKVQYHKGQQVLLDEMPVAHIIYRDAVMAAGKHVKGFVMTPRYDMRFAKVWLDK